MGPINLHVYVWETKPQPLNIEQLQTQNADHPPDAVGHVSLETSSTYFSMHPKYSFLVNPLMLFFPAPARNVSSLEEDIDLEGHQPDRKITLSLTPEQCSAISADCEEQKKAFASGRSLYHLLPNYGALPLIKCLSGPKAFTTFSSCPFTQLAMEQDDRSKEMQKIEQISEAHCALSIVSALKKGGIYVQTNQKLPWRITPSELGDSLSSMDVVKLNP